MEAREIVIILDCYFKHNWTDVMTAIAKKNFEGMAEPNVMISEIEKYRILNEGYRILTLLDPEYPDKIKTITKPPFVIYYKGNLDTVLERFTDPKYKYVPDKGCFLD